MTRPMGPRDLRDLGDILLDGEVGKGEVHSAMCSLLCWPQGWGCTSGPDATVEEPVHV
jgi:hypothetical protein